VELVFLSGFSLCYSTFQSSQGVVIETIEDKSHKIKAYSIEVNAPEETS